MLNAVALGESVRPSFYIVTLRCTLILHFRCNINIISNANNPARIVNKYFTLKLSVYPQVFIIIVG